MKKAKKIADEYLQTQTELLDHGEDGRSAIHRGELPWRRRQIAFGRPL